MSGNSIVNASSGTFTQGVTASSFTATGVGLVASQLRLSSSNNIVISSEASASLGGGVRLSTNIYVAGFVSAAKHFGDGTNLSFTVQAADTGIALTTADFGKTITVNSGSVQTIFLPSVSSADIGGQFSFVKLGAGNLVIDAADTDVIADSSAGGTIYNDTSSQVYATIGLRLVTDTKWVVLWGDGCWSTN